MKVIKPMRLGLLHRVFEHRRQPYLVVTNLLCFPFEAPRRLLHEASLWKIASEELGQGAILDEGNFKPRGEVLVSGRCFTAGAVPRPASWVRVKIGAVDKKLYVVGDRRWGLLGASDPDPFTEMRVSWREAFGGEGFAQNPVGKGFAKVKDGEAATHPLPNVEDPDRLIKSPSDRPTPAGFEGFEITWPQRMAKAGTYDEAWLKNSFPGVADDIDLGMFNVAPDDQQIEGYFQGDEAFVVENMHPDKPSIEGALPGLCARCFIAQKSGAEGALQEVPMRLDTVRLIPHRERGILIFRGLVKIQEEDAADVIHLLAACEAMGEPKPVDHYKAVLAQRLDRKKRHLYALRDRDLMPAKEDRGAPPLPDDRLSGMAELVRRQGILQENAKRGAARAREESDKKIEEAKNELRSRGINPEPYFPAAPAAAIPAERGPSAAESPDDLAEAMEQAEEEIDRISKDLEREKQQAEEARRDAEAKARALTAQHGLKLDVPEARAIPPAGGPPKLPMRTEIEGLEAIAEMARNGGVPWPDLEQRLADPEMERRMREAERQMLENYRRFAHHFPAAARLEGDAAARVREEVIAGHAEGKSFAGCDLTGADLSKLDLRGVDLEGAMLEMAQLAGADLRGSNLAGAVLARADLTGCDLTGAKVTGANFGAATMREVKAGGGLNFKGAVLAKADLTSADLTGARLDGADLAEARLSGADLSGAVADKMFFLRVDLSATKLAGVTFKRCVFIEVDVSGVDLQGSNLTRSAFIASKGDKAILRGATLERFRTLKGSSFAEADFQGATLKQANLMGTCLRGADFSDADLQKALLNECDLTGAKLDRAIAVDAMLMRTDLTGADLRAIDLMGAMLQQANLRGATLEDANLFAVSGRGMVGDDKTSLKGANVKRVSFVAARRTDEQG